MTDHDEQRLIAALEAAIGDRYRLQRELGRGGMARVFLATDVRHQREVAIKLVQGDDASGLLGDRFEREVAAVARLSHPHVVPLLDSGAGPGLRWFAMPVLDGASLRARLDREGALPLADAVRIAIEAARGLEAAHQLGILHRDVKPDNILLSGGVAVVADFGVAKLADTEQVALTMAGIAVGSASYISPEQATGDPVDARTDVYSLGAVLYEMLTGEPPFVGRTAQAVIAKRFTDPVPSAARLRDSVPPGLDAVVARAMAKQPTDRFAGMADFVRALERASLEPAPAHPGAGVPAHPARVTWRRTAIAAAVVALGALGALVWRWAPPDSQSLRIASIAVHPLADLSPAHDQEYFSAGMTDELLTALASVPGLRVASRSSSYAYKAQDSRAFGRQLNVDAVLDGTVRKDGDRIKVTAELVSVRDGMSLLTRTFERRLSDLFTLQEELAKEIVRAVGGQLGADAPLVRTSTTDVEAYQYYLRGRLALDRRTAPSLREARDWFQRAIAVDSGYARAWSGLADVSFVQAMNIFEPPGEAFPRARSAATRALALDSSLAEAHTSLATVRYFFDRDAAGAEAGFRRAMALDAKYAPARYWYGLLLAATGRSGEAYAMAEQARALDPFSPPIVTGAGMVRVLAGDYAAAVPSLREAVRDQPGYFFAHAWLALALVESGQSAEAVAEARKGVELAPEAGLAEGYLAYVLARSGARAAALEKLEALDALSRTRAVASVFVARAWDALGDRDRALAWLDRGLKAGEGQLMQVASGPPFRTIANDPRFTELLVQLHLR
jgi:serine/threonine-protein kinase